MVRECVKRILNEEIPDNPIPHMERCSTECNVMLGRFQPFTLGHLKCLKEIKNQTGRPTMLFVSPGKGDEKKPFKGELQDEMLKILRDAYPSLILDCIYLNGANIFEITDKCRERGYEPVSWTCGTDRSAAYMAMFSKYSDRYEYDKKLNLSPNFEVVTLNRDDDNISATRVREALKSGNKTEFEAMMPKALYCLFDDMRKVLTPDVLNEARGVPDASMKELAYYIWDRITEDGDRNFFLSIDDLDEYVHYYKVYKPLMVVTISNENSSSLAQFDKSQNMAYDKLTVNMAMVDSKGSPVSTIMHELTHMLNRNVPGNRIQGGISVQNYGRAYELANHCFYLFSDTECNARVAEFSMFLQENPQINDLHCRECEKVTGLKSMKILMNMIKGWGFMDTIMNDGDLTEMVYGGILHLQFNKKFSDGANKDNEVGNAMMQKLQHSTMVSRKRAILKNYEWRYKRYYNKILKVFADYAGKGNSQI